MPAWRVCNVPTCPNLSQGPRCEDCTSEAEQRRGNSHARGYGSKGHRAFRIKVLRRDRICVQCKATPATEADHYPMDRRTLVLKGLNPNDPRYGRGLCGPCHKRATAEHQPGGWNA